jgi:hypothetical protein
MPNVCRGKLKRFLKSAIRRLRLASLLCSLACVAASAQIGEPISTKADAVATFCLTDVRTGQPVTGLTDLRILVFEPPGVWQQRQIGKELGDGVYEVTQIFPHAGAFNIMAAVASRGVTFADLPFSTVRITESAPKGEVKKTEQNGASRQ